MDKTLELKNKIAALLADQLGLEQEDINEDDGLREDLHMNASALTDFFATLSQNGYDTSEVNIAEIETFEDVLDTIDQIESIE